MNTISLLLVPAFLSLILIDIFIFFYINQKFSVKEIRGKKSLNITATIIRINFITLGFLNFSFFVVAIIYILLYLYFLWLKFRYYLTYDQLFKINYFFVIIIGFLHALIEFSYGLGLGLFFVSYGYFLYKYTKYKTKSLNCRDLAILRLKANDYKSGWNLLNNALRYSKQMPTKILKKSKLTKILETEIERLENSNSEKLNIEYIFQDYDTSKKDLSYYLSRLTFIILTDFIILYLFFTYGG